MFSKCRIMLLLVSLSILFIGPQLVSRAQGGTGFTPGDHVVVIGKLASVHVQPDSSSTIVEELVTGMSSRVIAQKQDAQGKMWLYLVENAYGWLPAIDPVSGAPLFALSSDEILTQMVADATQAIATNSKDTEAYLTRASTYLSLYNYDAAIADYGVAINLAPQDGRLYDLRGKVEIYAKQYDQANNDLNLAITLKHTLPDTYNRLAIDFDNMGNSSQASINYMAAIKAGPDYGILYSNLAGFYANQGNHQQAIAQYDEAIKRDPFLAKAYQGRGDSEVHVLDYFKAIADYNKSIEIDPGCSNCYLQRGVFYANVQNNETLAFADFESAIKADPRNERALVDRGVGYHSRGQDALAMADLQQALQLNPKDDLAHFNLGFVNSSLGRFSDAIDSYTKAINLGGRYVHSTWLYRGQAYIALGQYDAAIADLTAYIGIITTNPPEFVTTAYLARAVADMDQGQYILAQRDYEAAFKLAPAFVKSYYSEGRGYRVTDYRLSMINDLQTKLQTNPKDTATMLEMGNLYMEFGRWQDAFAIYKNYLAQKDDPELRKLVMKLGTLFAN